MTYFNFIASKLLSSVGFTLKLAQAHVLSSFSTVQAVSNSMFYVLISMFSSSVFHLQFKPDLLTDLTNKRSREFQN